MLSRICVSIATLAATFAFAAVPTPSDFQAPGLFERNLGQYPADVAYRGRFPDLEAAILTDGSVSLYSRKKAIPGGVRLRALPPDSRPEIGAATPSSFRTNYFREGAAIVAVPHFSRLVVASAYRGIDLAYHGDGGKFEFDYIVSPGADIRPIRIAVEGAGSMAIDGNGHLVIERDGAVVLNRRPIAYQSIGDRRVPVAAKYVRKGPNVVGLSLGSYDRKAALVIDPVVEYSSYMGGTSNDFTSAVRISADGYVYLAGTTQSSNFPSVAALDSSLTGGTDAFVAKINLATGKPVYATFLGGRDADSASGLAIDSVGAVYVAGVGGSRYPVTAGAYRTTGSGALGFVTKLSPAGDVMQYSTFLPGARPAAITVDASGQAVVAGTAGTAFTTSPGAFQPTFGGGSAADPATMGDAFALKLNASGSNVLFATYFGGSGVEYVTGVALDPADRIAIAGSTTSSNLPTATPIQASLRGTEDGFLTIFAAGGGSLVSSTYFGGSAQDHFTGVATDLYGNVVVSGATRSDDLPTLNARLPRGALTTFTSTIKGFVAKIAITPMQLVFSTYTGAGYNCCDTTFGVATDVVGDIYVLGSVEVQQLPQFLAINSLLSKSYVSAKYGATDIRETYFVAGYGRDGLSLRYQSLVAPCSAAQDCNVGAGIAARMPGQVVIAGTTDLEWVPIAASNGQPKIASSPFLTDAWVMTVFTENPKVQLAASTGSTTAGATVNLTATTYTNAVNGNVTFWDDTVAIGTAPMVEGVARLDTSFSPGVRRLTATFNADRTPMRLIAVSPAAVCP